MKVQGSLEVLASLFINQLTSTPPSPGDGQIWFDPDGRVKLRELGTTHNITPSQKSIISTNTLSTTSSSYVAMTGMSLAGISGASFVFFRGNIFVTDAPSQVDILIYSGGSPTTAKGTFFCPTHQMIGSMIPVVTTAFPSPNNATVDVRWRVNGGATVYVVERQLFVLEGGA